VDRSAWGDRTAVAGAIPDDLLKKSGKQTDSLPGALPAEVVSLGVFLQ
jgi:hypothetical protein